MIQGKKEKEKEAYRRRIRRTLFWRRYGNAITISLMVGLAVASLFVAMLWRAHVDKKERELAEAALLQMPKGDAFSVSPVLLDPSILPKNAGEDYVILNDNIPGFNLYDLQHFTGESYCPLDALGRCGPAMALLHRSMMPKEERGEIGDVKPTGWVQKKYEGVVESTPPYLYNRCHLIAYALTGQNANEKNLITGTRHFNADVMLPFEVQVMEYLEHNDNHVLYRVTPYFQGTELLARGVEMEAYSVEDGGRGLCFHVFVYNTQPGITLDYATGESHAD